MSKQFNTIKRLRMLNGFTAKHVAEQTDTPIKVYYYYESGARFPNVKRLQAIAKFYGVTIDELLK